MKKLLVIVGPTATGKTSLGIKLARKFSGEIVSADSRQVYKHLDIGTGKDLPKNAKFNPKAERVRFGTGIQTSNSQFKNQKYTVGYYAIRNVKVWLYDVINPNQRFSAVEYAELAWRVMEDIWKREKLPILVGGTGFYIKAMLEGIETAGVEQDWDLREELDNLTIEELKSRLKEVDSTRFKKMNNSDRNNPRRLIRAIEIVKQKARPRTRVNTVQGMSKKQKAKIKIKKCNTIIIGLTTDRKILYERIDQRVENRVEQGTIDEIKNLLGKGYSLDDPGFDTLGYKEWRLFFEREAKFDAVVQRWKYDEHAYARRQLTWFKKNKKINWYDITKYDFKRRVEERVKKWYYK